VNELPEIKVVSNSFCVITDEQMDGFDDFRKVRVGNGRESVLVDIPIIRDYCKGLFTLAPRKRIEALYSRSHWAVPK
jgi:hypothetical protein